ncbi:MULTISPECIES: lipid-binding SYLF domain-containing protein [Achromobacter]|jgi:lipid-binding SYLF domain-containing protein|nr:MULTISPECIES: lipid-binding SYLF domain-containing protein [Achromobacter]MDQ1760076.1 lipid-binding SYLF domain-containing protein [Achromobacter aegrifaciens]MDR7947054.1 lipid-binding SYLF domain-containing protein [Achromobacter aegrifaciens]
MSIRGWLWASLFLWVACIFLAPQARAESAAELSREAQSALDRLYQQEPKTRVLGNKAVGVLVFPRILKGGLLVGAETGDGALIRRGKVQAYYNISAVSFGLQAGAQEFSYALFFMNEPAMRYLDQSDGWSLGAGPSLVVVDDSYAASITTTTLSQDVYAVPFGGQGLMAGMGLEGSKITRTQPD